MYNHKESSFPRVWRPWWMQGSHLIRAGNQNLVAYVLSSEFKSGQSEPVGSPGMDFNHPPLPPAGFLRRTLESFLYQSSARTSQREHGQMQEEQATAIKCRIRRKY